LATRAKDTSGSANSRSNTAGPNRSQEVIEKAVDLFNRQGYSATSVEDVAAALGILKGSLYYYIDSKEDLLFEIVNEVHQEVRRIFSDALKRIDLPAVERLALYVRSQATYNAENVAKISVYYNDLHSLSKQHLKDIRRRQREHFNALIALLNEVKKEGRMKKSLDSTLAARTILAVVISIYTWYRPADPASVSQLADVCVGFVIGGISGFDPVEEPAAA
jgi:AcrR family transcriptional regulator